MLLEPVVERVICVYLISYCNYTDDIFVTGRLFIETKEKLTCHVEVHLAGCPHSCSAEGMAGGAVGKFQDLCTGHFPVRF